MVRQRIRITSLDKKEIFENMRGVVKKMTIKILSRITKISQKKKKMKQVKQIKTNRKIPEEVLIPKKGT